MRRLPRKFLNERRIHLLFKIGVVIKGLDGALELVAGIALGFTSNASLRNLAAWATQGELQEDPNDFIANHLVDFFHHLSINTRHFAAIYLVAYGLVKLGLVIGLLRGNLRAYPAALVMLGLFLGYQIYRLSHNHSPSLAFFSLLDLAILIVIWRDYKYMKSGRHGRSGR